MNSKIIALIIAGLVIIGLVIYLMGGKSGENQATQTVETESTSEEVEENDSSFQEEGFGSLAAFFGLGRDLTCTFSHTDTETGALSTGDFYYDGGAERFRVDSTSSVDGGTYVSHMINDRESLYLWTEGTEGTFAIRMNSETYESNQDLPNTEGQNETQPFSVDEQVEYDCDPWNVDATLFAPPAGVEFLDMESMMQDMMQNMPEGFELPEGF